VDKVYDAKNNFWITIYYRKIGSKNSEILKRKDLRKNSKPFVFILNEVKLGVGLYFSDVN